MLPSQKRTVESTYDSLYSLMNCCSSLFGQRYLHYNLANPLVDTDEIVGRHEAITELKKDDLYKTIRRLIGGSLDGERIVRSLEIRRSLSPSLVENLWRFLEMWREVSKVWDCDITDDVWKAMLDNLEETFDRSALEENGSTNWFHPISLSSEYKSDMDSLKER